jgi:hypothetical protein
MTKSVLGKSWDSTWDFLIPDLSFNKFQFDPTVDYGKNTAILIPQNRPQDIDI